MRKSTWLHALVMLLIAVGAFQAVARAEGKAADAAEDDAAKGLGLRIHNIKEYGPTGTLAQTVATFKKALDIITTDGGGILIVPEGVPSGARLENVAQWSHSIDPASCSLRDWKMGRGVLVLDNREGKTTFRVAQVGAASSGGAITFSRTMRLPEGDSLQHWGRHSVLDITNNIIHGPCNYLDWIVAPVKKGKDARFYVPTIRDIFEGMYLNAHHGPGYRGPVARITVKKIGYDKDRHLHYFTADTNTDLIAGAIVQNKSHTPAIHIVTNANAANQTFDFYLERNHYANGDTYLLSTRFNYMGNVHSAAGDENGVCYQANIVSLTNVFRGVVRSVDWAKSALVFRNGQNANTLSNTRPLINLNEKKWTTKGSVLIVPPSSYWDTVNDGRWVYQGKSYPTTIGVNPKTGVSGLRMGGLIRGDKNCGWDESILGRWFAVDEPTEYVPGRTAKLRRWYEISGLTKNADGTCDIVIKRFWWGTKEAGSPTLYDPENYTRDGHVKPLKYVIAPGTYVFDVSQAVAPNALQGIPPFTLRVAPYADSGTSFDFAPEDPIEQAIGPDPFKPQAIRAWCFDSVPGAWPAAMIDLANHGAVARDSAITVAGGPSTLEACETRRERRPAWDNVLVLNSAAGVGIACNADFKNAAILFRQPNHEQAIKWHYGQQEGAAPKVASLTVERATGDFVLQGGAVRAGGGVTEAAGLSGDKTPARNLRGKNVPVKEGAKWITIKFPTPEPDADYAVFIEQNWLSNRAVTIQEATGFTVTFDKPAPAGAKIHWMIVR